MVMLDDQRVISSSLDPSGTPPAGFLKEFWDNPTIEIMAYHGISWDTMGYFIGYV